MEYHELDFDPEFKAILLAHMRREQSDTEGAWLPHPGGDPDRQLWMCDVGTEGCFYCRFAWEKAG